MPWQGLDVSAFDYWYYEESTDGKGNRSKTYYRFDCAIAPVDAACPPLTIERENVLTKLAGALSFHDIQFEDETFNKAFNVRSPEPKFANDAIDARMMQWLMAHGKPFHIELVGNRVLVAGKKCDADRAAAGHRHGEGVPRAAPAGRVLVVPGHRVGSGRRRRVMLWDPC